MSERVRDLQVLAPRSYGTCWAEERFHEEPRTEANS